MIDKEKWMSYVEYQQKGYYNVWSRHFSPPKCSREDVNNIIKNYDTYKAKWGTDYKKKVCGYCGK